MALDIMSKTRGLDAPQDRDQMRDWLIKYAGVSMPDSACCPEHTSPLDALWGAYSAEAPRTVWWASRGYGGKSVSLAALIYVEGITLGAEVALLGGSLEQSQRVHEYLKGERVTGWFWDHPNAPTHLLKDDHTKRRTRLTNNGLIEVLTASQKSVRGPHPHRLRGDEIDEMEQAVWDAAQGQTKSGHIGMQTVGSSTYQNANGTMMAELKLAKQKGFPVIKWCLPPDGKILDGAGRPVRIADVSVGDTVLSGTGVPRPVTRLWRRTYVGDMIEFSVQGYQQPIKVTGDHEVYTDRGVIPARDLRVGDRMEDPGLSMEPGGSYEDGWLVGVYLAEGHKPKSHRNRNSVTFSVHEEEAAELVGRLEAWWEAHPVDSSGKWNADGPRVRPIDYARAVNVQASHEELHSLLDKWVDLYARDGEGAGSGARAKVMKKLPTHRDFAAGVLDGWIFGDGSRYEQGRMLGNTASEDLAWQMVRIASGLGYISGVGCYDNDRGYSSGGEVIWAVRINEPQPPFRKVNRAKITQAQSLYRQARSVNAVAKELRVSWETAKAMIEWCGYKTHFSQADINPEGGFYRQVKEVRAFSYSGDVHDITVDVDHTFLAGGVTVSNCWRCVLDENGGWLTEEEAETKFSTITKQMKEVEYELKEPSVSETAFDRPCVRRTFTEELGVFEGGLNTVHTFEEREAGGEYATGADWGKSRDRSIIITMRYDCTPARVVKYRHMGQVPFPQMVAAFNQDVEQYDSVACHDATGIGAVIDDYLEVMSEAVKMVGKRRSDLFGQYTVAIEQDKIRSPQIEYMQHEHVVCTVGDLYSAGHPPDTVVAMAMAWRAATGLGLLY